MLIENIELTMSHVSLGNLTEYALMVLFGNSHSHFLTLNTSNTPDEIKDANGNYLYPAYYMTHLQVPINQMLWTYKLWDKINVGVDVKRFGETILESEYLIGKENEIPGQTSEWRFCNLPYMKANNLFIIDTRVNGNRKIVTSNPERSCVNQLEKVAQTPESLKLSKEIRKNGFKHDHDMIALPECKPLIYKLEKDRDGPFNHTILFAKYSEIMNWAEKKYLAEYMEPTFPKTIIENIKVMDRKTFYYGNCFPEEKIKICISTSIKECNENFQSESTKYFSLAIMEFCYEIYLKRTNTLLILSKAKKLISLPLELTELSYDFYRVINTIKNKRRT